MEIVAPLPAHVPAVQVLPEIEALLNSPVAESELKTRVSVVSSATGVFVPSTVWTTNTADWVPTGIVCGALEIVSAVTSLVRARAGGTKKPLTKRAATVRRPTAEPFDQE